ncbi:amidohydrolase family protein [Cyclobacterium xiamenense]|uniref:amidohydrolase family protein n=1 Tax=Cyclobacterium xiamenense TaxID=1297121 RepID=UPI001C431CFE|nr:amidohydrolase family protein [Cyclobacterium xiamenense]
MAQKKPIILVTWGDDLGMWNISAFHRGMMGGNIPNIDRVEDERMIFMDHYDHASWTAVTRNSRTGGIIGEEERLAPYQALQASTIWSACQHFEEDRKGGLRPGKLAELVILGQNPQKVDPDVIKDIEVLETIREGTKVYSKN